MALRVDRPSGYLFTENTITDPTETAKEKGSHIPLCKALSRCVLCMNVVLVHSRDTKEAKNHIMHLETNPKPDNRMDNGKCSTIEKEESGHSTAVVPVW